MDGAPVMSWEEAKAMCEGVGDVFERNASKDRERVLKLRQRFGSIRANIALEQATARQAVVEALSEITKIQEDEQGRDNSAEMTQRLVELGETKVKMQAQLDQLKDGQVATQMHIEELISEYEQAQRRYLEECATREKDIPRLRQIMSVYANLTGIKWDFSSERIAGCIHNPGLKLLSNFELNPTDSPFDTANALWDIIDKAHGPV
ncbi:hypothetical protein ACHHYP_01195 [Achlya hypogyna]|uniref:Kinetochore protein Spc24 n=1 Tax=Achlya hypogyna TaxID=1202772 RepID=A0A1V9ZTK0_ACHHY|nr:hypothetical protein ACHHYP_01195 [Achlya hypogyna]